MVMAEGQDEEVPQEESEMIHMKFNNRDHFIQTTAKVAQIGYDYKMGEVSAQVNLVLDLLRVACQLGDEKLEACEEA